MAVDSAGLVKVPTLKGIHYAMRSGMSAADTIFDALRSDDVSETALAGYREALLASDVGRDLYASRNFRSSFHGGLYSGIVRWGTRMLLGGGSRRRGPAEPDWKRMRHADRFPERPPGPKPDGKLFLDKLSDVHRSGTAHRDDAPSHIRVIDPSVCIDRCLPTHGTVPCEHFCPAQVYQMQGEGAARRIEVSFQNCVHCKTCVILDPCDAGQVPGMQNIQWRAPAEGAATPKIGKSTSGTSEVAGIGIALVIHQVAIKRATPLTRHASILIPAGAGSTKTPKKKRRPIPVPISLASRLDSITGTPATCFVFLPLSRFYSATMLWKPAFMKAKTHKNYPKSTIARMLRGTKEEQHYRHVFSAL